MLFPCQINVPCKDEPSRSRYWQFGELRTCPPHFSREICAKNWLWRSLSLWLFFITMYWHIFLWKCIDIMYSLWTWINALGIVYVEECILYLNTCCMDCLNIFLLHMFQYSKLGIYSASPLVSYPLPFRPHLSSVLYHLRWFTKFYVFKIYNVLLSRIVTCGLTNSS